MNNPSSININSEAHFETTISTGKAQQLAKGWLILGLSALAASGLFSILIVLSRTPYLHEIIPFKDFFHTALVVHVDLSVLIWFLALAGTIWTLNSSSKASLLGKLALFLCSIGTIGIIIAPFTGEGNAIMNNYIPILQNQVFYIGLGFVGVGFSLLVFRSLIATNTLNWKNGSGALSIGSYASVVTSALTLLALVWSWQQLDNSTLEAHAYFETLFWGSGHVLQFTHTVLLLVVWLWLAQACGAKIVYSPKLVSFLFVIIALPALTLFLIYPIYEVISPEHRIGFTQMMRHGGLASLPLGLLAVWSILRSGKIHSDHRPIRNALFASILLFAMGGVLAFMIKGINVVIPAHYHGSIVGVTLAFMGLTYYLLPKFGYGIPSPKLAAWQPLVYAGGQLMHILGLAWSGGYGVKRKTAGAAQGLENLPEIAGMAMMGLGGLIAIIGGILFIVVAIRSIWFKSATMD